MEVSEALKGAENSVRNLISHRLDLKLGKDWLGSCGVTEERLQIWKERKAVEEKRLSITDDRIIYYSDFYDLLTILKKHWSDSFQMVFGKLKQFEVLWSILEGFRNPDAHRRELLPYQISLILGITGKIRTEITTYFSKMETGESYFPRLESIQDSLGNVWTHGINTSPWIIADNVLRPGDILEFTATAFDPLGEQLSFCFVLGLDGDINWQAKPTKILKIRKQDIGKNFTVAIKVASDRDYHAYPFYDDRVQFLYTVVPPIISHS